MILSTILHTALSVLLVLSSPMANAAIPSILGSYSGQESGLNSGCAIPANNGAFTDPVSLSFTSQSGGSFTGKVDNITLTGLITATGSVSGSFSGPSGSGGIDSGTFTGQLVGNSLVLSYVGSNIGGDFCTGTGTITATRSGGQDSDTVVDEESAPTQATTPAVLQSQITAISSNTSIRVQNALQGLGARPRQIANGFMLESDSGLAAGDNFAGFGIWTSYSRSEFDNDFAAIAFDGERDMTLFGIDTLVFDSVVIGVALGYESSDIDTFFNGGEQESDGYTLSPYLGAVLTDNWSIDVSLGYSAVETDQIRRFAGTPISSSVEARRWFWSSNLNGYWMLDRHWRLGSQLGFLYAREFQDAYVESNGSRIADRTVKLGQWHLGGELAYLYGDWEPFGRLSYQNDYAATRVSVAGGGAQPSSDHDDIMAGLGLRYFSGNGVSGVLEWNRRLGRDNLSEDLYTLSLRLDF